jgi:hypothetical protein
MNMHLPIPRLRVAAVMSVAALACACGSDSSKAGASGTSGSAAGSSTGAAGAGSGAQAGTGSGVGPSGSAAGAMAGMSGVGAAGSTSGESAGSGGSAGATGAASSGGAGAAASGSSASGAGTSGGATKDGGASGSATSGGTSGASSGAMSGTTSGLGGSSGSTVVPDSGAPVTGPCDIYATGGTPCVAAFSTVRALYGGYAGSLYQVRRADSTTHDVAPLTPGGVASAATQDAFCSGTTCTISIIYDQSGKGNDLTKAPGGSAAYGPNPDVEAVADALPITLGGHKAYGVHITPSPSWTSPGQVGYRNTNTSGTAKNDDPETEYMVTDGTYFNGSCCFDFGNAEMQPVAGGPGTMEAIYFGNCNWWDKGANASGPWVMADLEVGVFNQGGAAGATNTNDVDLAFPFATAMLEGNSASAAGGGPFTLKGANAQSGTLSTIYDGARPNSYSPMHKQGGIVLGIGGDNSSTAQGNFFEGVMTTGYAVKVDAAVQANIVAAGYGK